MTKTSGYTMVEMLVATAILGIVLAMASQGIVLSLKFHRNQQAVVTAQSKLRQVNAAISQELRSAALGGISDFPVVSNSQGISFMLLDGGTGYQVINSSSTSLDFVADAADTTALGMASQPEFLLVDSKGEAVVVAYTASTNLSSSGSNVFKLNYKNCADILTSSDLLLFPMQAIGFRYSATDKVLYRVDSSNTELPLAFDLSSFSINQVLNAAGTETVRLDITSTAEYVTVGGQSKEKTASGQVDLPQSDSSTFNRRIKGVKVCN